MKTNADDADRKIKTDDLMRHRALGLVRVIAVDSDPTAAVWVVLVTDPDRDAFVMRSELKPA